MKILYAHDYGFLDLDLTKDVLNHQHMLLESKEYLRKLLICPIDKDVIFSKCHDVETSWLNSDAVNLLLFYSQCDLLITQAKLDHVYINPSKTLYVDKDDPNAKNIILGELRKLFMTSSITDLFKSFGGFNTAANSDDSDEST